MRKQGVLIVAFGVVFSFALTASCVQADAVHSNKLIAQLNGVEHRTLDLPGISRAEEHGYLFSGVHSNNGKHLGFSIPLSITVQYSAWSDRTVPPSVIIRNQQPCCC
jgi:hypothetical protein